MKGNFSTGRRPSLTKRLESLRRQNRALGARDQAHRCPTCKAPLTGQTFTVFGSPVQYCRLLCLPNSEAAQ